MTDCAVCGRRIEPSDGVVSMDFDPQQYGNTDLLPTDDPLMAAGFAYWVHVACTADAAKRWCRAGRPESDPLSWVRSNGLNWTGLQGSACRGRLILDGPD